MALCPGWLRTARARKVCPWGVSGTWPRRFPPPLVQASSWGGAPLDLEPVVTQHRGFSPTFLVFCLRSVLRTGLTHGSICATICGMRNKQRRVMPQSVARQTVVVTVPEVTIRELAQASAHQATLARTRWHLLEERAIKQGRSAGVSWDELGRWLLCPGESLRRRYSSMVD